ncbi:MAG TPA: helix-turn-helix domain-containing protein [Thermoanaerobaculia bacterium]|nr:helix-turn-helix domain-containing protein [Thermoanaerobaculia bacterium]
MISPPQSLTQAGQELFTVYQVAERLQLHPKTVRQFIRDGRLTATRVGKSYRIAARDLAALAGEAAAASEPPVLRSRHVEASSTVDVHAISPAAAERLTATLASALRGPHGEGEAVRLDTLYDEERGRLKLVLTGNVGASGYLLKLIAAYLEA